MKNRPVLFYCKDDVLCPVALTESQQQIFEMTVSLISPLKVVLIQPQGPVVDLLERKE